MTTTDQSNPKGLVNPTFLEGSISEKLTFGEGSQDTKDKQIVKITFNSIFLNIHISFVLKTSLSLCCTSVVCQKYQPLPSEQNTEENVLLIAWHKLREECDAYLLRGESKVSMTSGQVSVRISTVPCRRWQKQRKWQVSERHRVIYALTSLQLCCW